jgi:hypothetical protein
MYNEFNEDIHLYSPFQRFPLYPYFISSESPFEKTSIRQLYVVLYLHRTLIRGKVELAVIRLLQAAAPVKQLPLLRVFNKDFNINLSTLLSYHQCC